MEEYERIVESEKSLTEKILTVFPGYGGYRKREVLRETDRLVRDTLYNELKKAKERFSRICKNMVTSGQAEAKEAERILMRIDACAERIHHAPYGYTPELNVIQIKEDHIRKLIQFDSKLSEGIANLREKVEALGNSQSADTKALLSQIESGVTDFEEGFANRKNFMMGLEGGQK